MCISGQCAADEKIDVAEGPKILEIQKAYSVHERRETFYIKKSGKKGPSLGVIHTADAFECSFLGSKIRGSNRRRHLGQRASTNSKETLTKTEQQSSHPRKCGVFLRHHQEHQMEQSLSWIPGAVSMHMLSRKD